MSSESTARIFWSATADQRLAHSIQNHDTLPRHGAHAFDAQKVVDEEVDAARSAVCAMLTRRNTFAAISILPSEVLARVFDFVALAAPPGHSASFDYSKPRTSILGWISSVTHICRHWRHVALDYPNIWGRISFEIGAIWTDEMITRTKAAPMFIDQTRIRSRVLHGGSDPMLVTHLPHIQELRVVRNSTAMAQLLPKLNGPAPLLKKLGLSLDSATNDFPYFTLPKLFDDQAPNLCEMTLTNIPFSWTSLPTGSCLTHLTIKWIRYPHSTGLSVTLLGPYDLFLEFLENTPALEELDLDDCLPPRSGGLSTDRTVSLPCLTRTSLHGPALDVAEVLKHILIPPSTKLSLQCVSSSTTEDECFTALSLASAHLRARGTTTKPVSMHMLSIESPTSGLHSSVVRIKVHRRSLSIDDIPQFGASSLDLSLSLAWGPYASSVADGIPVSVLRKVCDVLPLNDMRTLALDVQSSDWINSSQWQETFGKYRALEQVLATGIPATHLFRALGKATATEQTDGVAKKKRRRNHSNLLFPKLHTLYIEDVDFENGYSVGDDSGLQSSLYDILTASLTKRKPRKAGVKKLVIQSCTFDGDERLGDLEPLVDKVEWDHDTGDLYGEDEDEDDEDLEDEDYYDEYYEDEFESEYGGPYW